jgi:hypothetical protein
MVSCNILGMPSGSYYGHALSKVYQYVTIDERKRSHNHQPRSPHLKCQVKPKVEGINKRRPLARHELSMAHFWLWLQLRTLLNIMHLPKIRLMLLKMKEEGVQKQEIAPKNGRH